MTEMVIQEAWRNVSMLVRTINDTDANVVNKSVFHSHSNMNYSYKSSIIDSNIYFTEVLTFIALIIRTFLYFHFSSFYITMFSYV